MIDRRPWLGAGQTGSAASGSGPDTDGRPALPPDRYGSARKRSQPIRGWRRWALVVVAIVLSGVAAYVGYRNFGSAPIDAQRVAFEERPGNAMEITIDVTRDQPERAAVCIVRVRDISGTESGRREVFVPPERERLSTVIHSIGTPVTADVYGCTYDIPEYLSTP